MKLTCSMTPRQHVFVLSLWRHQKHFSTLLVRFAGKPPVTGKFCSQKPVTRGFGVFFDLRLNKRLSKRLRHRWFQTPTRAHYDVTVLILNVQWAIHWACFDPLVNIVNVFSCSGYDRTISKNYLILQNRTWVIFQISHHHFKTKVDMVDIEN